MLNPMSSIFVDESGDQERVRNVEFSDLASKFLSGFACMHPEASFTSELFACHCLDLFLSGQLFGQRTEAGFFALLRNPHNQCRKKCSAPTL